MNMKEFIKSLNKSDRELIAKKAGTTDDYLFQIAGGHRNPSAALAKKLEIASGGVITRADLRPDIFGDIDNNNAA